MGGNAQRHSGRSDSNAGNVFAEIKLFLLKRFEPIKCWPGKMVEVQTRHSNLFFFTGVYIQSKSYMTMVSRNRFDEIKRTIAAGVVQKRLQQIALP
jgi:hypothetical protein